MIDVYELKCKTLAIESREFTTVIGILCAGRLLQSRVTSRGDELFDGFTDGSRWQIPGYEPFLYVL